MKTPASNRQSGIALIVVMIAITVLTMLTVAFAFTMKVETKLAQNSNSDEQLRALGYSGAQYACLVLSAQLSVPNEPYDALNQVWAGGPGTENDSNSVLSTISLSDYAIGDGRISIKIVDLERYVNINTASEAQLRQAFILLKTDAGNADTAISSILDWVQPGENPRPNGAKSDYYQGLTPPYYCKDAPMDDLSELQLVKGVTQEMYWGATVTNHSPAAFQGLNRNSNQGDDLPDFGLKDLFTPMSTGKVNVNTASPEVLALIPGLNPDTAAGIVSMRSQDPIPNVGELINVPGMNQADLSQAAQYLDVRSHTFMVTTTAEVAGYKREFVSILGRTSASDIKVLSFYLKDRTGEPSAEGATH